MQYSDITDSLAERWEKNKNVNPLTGGKIKTYGKIYNMYYKYVNYMVPEEIYEPIEYLPYDSDKGYDSNEDLESSDKYY